MKPKTDGQRSDKCTSILEHCQEAAESSLLVGWSGLITPDLTQLSASSLPGRPSVKAWFKKTKNLCKHCTIAWDKMVIQGTKFPDVLNIYFYRTRSYNGSVHGSLTTAWRMLLREENKPKLSFCLVLHWALSYHSEDFQDIELHCTSTLTCTHLMALTRTRCLHCGMQ